MKTRGERLKARRLEMKLTLREVAEAVDISIAGVQNLERGDVMPSLEIGIALVSAYASQCIGCYMGQNMTRSHSCYWHN
ncbi:helix-turn-helix domain-containing protein [Escherichia coli]